MMALGWQLQELRKDGVQCLPATDRMVDELIQEINKSLA